MKGMKMILLVTGLGMCMFFLQGCADDSGMSDSKMQEMEQSAMMHDDADMNKTTAGMEGSMKKDMDESMNSGMKEPVENTMEQPKQGEMNKMMPADKEAPMQGEMKKPMENGKKMMQ